MEALPASLLPVATSSGKCISLVGMLGLEACCLPDPYPFKLCYAVLCCCTLCDTVQRSVKVRRNLHYDPRLHRAR